MNDDLAKYLKVCALIKRATTDGERAAAEAAKARMTEKDPTLPDRAAAWETAQAARKYAEEYLRSQGAVPPPQVDEAANILRRFALHTANRLWERAVDNIAAQYGGALSKEKKKPASRQTTKELYSALEDSAVAYTADGGIFIGFSAAPEVFEALLDTDAHADAAKRGGAFVLALIDNALAAYHDDELEPIDDEDGEDAEEDE